MNISQQTEYKDQFPNPFIAAISAAKSARARFNSTKGRILESEALSWEISGVAPRYEHKKCMREIDPQIALVEDVLASVDDVKVKSSVRISYSKSLKHHHLIYCYHPDLDDFQKGRVRILIKMIWMNIEQERSNSHDRR